MRTPPAHNIAILVNGGSFNPIHNGHLEMYTLARTELITKLGFHDVLVIYVVSPYGELYKKISDDHENAIVPNSGGRTYTHAKIIPRNGLTKDQSITEHIFDGINKFDRIKICREAFASIDNVSYGKQPTADDQHLSQNMFVWPV